MTQLRDILRAADTLADRYDALRAELIRQTSSTSGSRSAFTLKPLTVATHGPGGHNTPVEWTQQLDSAFRQAKAALSDAAALAHPLQNAYLSLAVDASDHHMGGVLQQHSGDVWQPLAFFSRKLNSAESRYSTFDRELLACVSTIPHFRFLLEGRQFFILSDQKPLSYALHRVSDPWSARQPRHLAYVDKYTSEIHHVPGADNVVCIFSELAAGGCGPTPAVAAVVP